MKRLLTALWAEGSRHRRALFGSFLVFLPVRTGRLSEANWANYRLWLGRRWSWAGGRADVGSCFHSEGFNVPYLPEFVPSWSLQNSSVVTSECRGAESTLAQLLRYLRVLMRQQVQYLLLVLWGEMPKLREGRAAYETLRLSSISVFWSTSQGEGTLSRSALRPQAPRAVSSRVRASPRSACRDPAGSGARGARAWGGTPVARSGLLYFQPLLFCMLMAASRPRSQALRVPRAPGLRGSAGLCHAENSSRWSSCRAVCAGSEVCPGFLADSAGSAQLLCSQRHMEICTGRAGSSRSRARRFSAERLLLSKLFMK